MDNIQVLEPAFHIVTVPSSRLGGEARPGRPAGFSAAALPGSLKCLGISLLERMNICSMPRILSAQCLAGELPGEAE